MSELSFREISKSFGAVRAVQDVSFSVRRGESHALMGENGAGKSTLMKILAGIERPDHGELRWEGRRLDLAAPRDALDEGIGMVHQEVMLFPNLSATENIFAGRELKRGSGRLRRGEMRQRTAALLDQLHVPVDPDTPVASLGIAHQQLLQIARALAFECRILILDEPTTCLTSAETGELFLILEKLLHNGVTLLYVSHRLEEVFRLCERITVLRDGRFVGTFERKESDPDQIVRSMVGRELPPRAAGHAAPSAATGKPLLEVVGLARRPWFEDISLTVRPGEIVALFGLVGSGRSELLETVFGLYAPDAGEVRFDGARLELRSAVDAVRAGIVLAPEERHRQGLFFNLSLGDNLLLPGDVARGGWLLKRREERRRSARLMSEWRIKATDVDAPPDSLSGGNQQKVVLAKWLSTEPRLLLLDEPTKGVDVGAKYEIHDLIRAQAARGMGCLLVSSDLPEVLALAHRVVVLREGRLRGELDSAEAGEEPIMRLATAVGPVRAGGTLARERSPS